MKCNHYTVIRSRAKKSPMSKYGLGFPLYFTEKFELALRDSILDRSTSVLNSFWTKHATCEATLPHLLEPASVVTVCST